VLAVFIASDALTLTQEPCQWLWSWILLETMMGLYAHKVCDVVDTRCGCADLLDMGCALFADA
jgi:hypothetical protein